MAIIVGSEYWKKKDSLVERVLTGTIDVVPIESKDYACYFCEKKIERRTYLLVDENEKSITRIPIDEGCYESILLQRN
ncbi:hypothetical protein COV12_00965 [Candidatus Woesearchaeota archaeon CG10_big_fil_rev_8_21_14_0_10_32_24]|nr:MAG: hypothetical protein COV12_00965 [Candidatus Woesearchaeota archaeon CG10_big_fil_rev_8_21_14_0_10_32_24]